MENQRQTPTGAYGPAKPDEGWFTLKWKNRIKAAFLCLFGKAAAVRWY